MGKRTYFTQVALFLGLAALVPQCACKPQTWNQPKIQLPQTPVFDPGQLPIDCAELVADRGIPEFLIRELCNPQLAGSVAGAAAEANDQTAAVEAGDQEGAAVEAKDQEEAGEAKDQGGAVEAKDQEGAGEAKDQGGPLEAKDQEGAGEAKDQGGAVEAKDQEGAGEAKDQEGAGEAKDQQGAGEAKNQEAVAETKDQEGAEDAAKEESEAAERPSVGRLSSGVVLEPSQVIVPFFRVVIQKLASADAKVPDRDLWAKAYQEAGAPKLSRHPTFFEIAAGLQQAVESFRSEESWWSVVRLIENLTSDKQWQRLEAAVVAAHGQDPGNLWRALGASKALKVALKSSIKEPECRVEGLNPDPEDCREFVVCFRYLGRWKSKDAKCPKYTEFSPSRLRCVWAPLSDCKEQSDSSDSDSDESSREVVERILKHGSGAFHV